MPNNLINETSPYLLQHAENPVQWFPWNDDAFVKAKLEDKPVFLSIGYSTCHWCHVMERESFEDQDVAAMLNSDFICVKVDKEERPDIDSIYMSVCQAVTGAGGWPLTILMTPDKAPFYAATYLPKHGKYNLPGLMELLPAIVDRWNKDRGSLLKVTENITTAFQKKERQKKGGEGGDFIEKAVSRLKASFDSEYGGFGDAPKFPIPHNLLFLLRYYEDTQDKQALEMAVQTLHHMYRGGIFDHIGFGFSRYSTDAQWLAPHFEKMLYDNALLAMAYTEGFHITKEPLFSEVTAKIIRYVLRELTHPEGGFYCAQDADSEGVEGKYYLFQPQEILNVLGPEAGNRFNAYFDIQAKGNFEGLSIPNLIHRPPLDTAMEQYLPNVFAYRKNRMALHKDNKILVSWNGLMIAALAKAYGSFNEAVYLAAAEKAVRFILSNMSNGGRLYTSYRQGKHSPHGFIDDYAFFVFGLIELYKVTLNRTYIERAEDFMHTALNEFWDDKDGGFYLYGTDSEQFFMRPKETYDGATPSANAVMVYNLCLLWRITKADCYQDYLVQLKHYLAMESADYPQGHCFYLYALLLQEKPVKEITCVLSPQAPKDTVIKQLLKEDAIVTILETETKAYPLKNHRTTYYVCEGFSCKPPVNELHP